MNKLTIIVHTNIKPKWTLSHTLIYLTLCCEKTDPSYDHQEYERSADLCWTLGWIAFGFGTLKQREIMPEMQLGWIEASPWWSHTHEQVFEPMPRTQLAQQQACRLVQSENQEENFKPIEAEPEAIQKIISSLCNLVSMGIPAMVQQMAWNKELEAANKLATFGVLLLVCRNIKGNKRWELRWIMLPCKR